MTGSPDQAARPPPGGWVPAGDFQTLFESAPGLCLVLDPGLRIVAASNAYLQATMTTRAELMGRHVFDAFPDNQEDPNATGVANLRASLERVSQSGEADTMAVQKYEVATSAEHGGGFEVRYWSICNSPVIGADGHLLYIVNTVQDVTEFVQLQRQGSHADELTAELRERTQRMQAEILRRANHLQTANEALRTSSEAKTEFLSRVSHELRTPLTAILGFSELLSLDPVSAEHRDWITVIIKAGRHLTVLLDDLLDISRIEGGHLSTTVEPVPVAPLVADALNLARPLAHAGGVHLSDPPPIPADLCVAADRQRLRQVLLNLLSNAIKFNHPTGTVSIAVGHPAAGRLRLSVSDTGRGIPPDALGKLFTPFERLDAAQAGFPGTGLGLALSRHLMQTMHGTLDVRSSPGRGSTFSIDLPTAEPASADPPATEADEPVTSRAYDGDKRVLYVEDIAENVRLVEQILRHRPSVTLIPDMLGGIALDLARQHHPHLVLLDLNLPDIPGEEVLRRLRADPATSDIPIVVLSADATQHHIDQLLAAGAAGYLTKPIAVRTLLHTIDELLDDAPGNATAAGPATAELGAPGPPASGQMPGLDGGIR